jgi:1,4-dihydroxy-2-naphthoate octaprenyltransferase
MNSISTVFQTARPPFLLLVLSCLLLPLGYAQYRDLEFDVWVAALVVLSALSAHVSVNMFNEYKDCCSQLDMNTERTPFSGGSGALVAKPKLANRVKGSAIVFLMITLLSGLGILYFQTEVAGTLIALGLVGSLLIVLYTPWLNRLPLVCLLAPGIGFGLVMSYGAYIALTGTYSSTMLVLSLIPLLLTNNLLLLNQFPDAKVDAEHGRHHWVIKYGYSFSAVTWLVQLLCVFGLLLLLLWQQQIPIYSSVLLLFLIPAIWIYRQAYDFSQLSQTFIKAMGLNVAMSLIFPAALGGILCVAA